jgi:hypothetical protein
MNTPVLALIPVLPGSTGTGANAGPAQQHQGHRNHAMRDSRMETRRAGNRGASRAFRGLGASLFPLFFRPSRDGQPQVRGRE